MGFEYLQRRRLHSLPGQPGPGLRHPQREEVLPRVLMDLPMPQFVPVVPCPVAGHHWKESGPVLLTPPQTPTGISKVPSQPSPGWTRPAQRQDGGLETGDGGDRGVETSDTETEGTSRGARSVGMRCRGHEGQRRWGDGTRIPRYEIWRHHIYRGAGEVGQV